MQLISVNVGLPREVPWNNITISTGIYKKPVTGDVAVHKLNLDGDRQADLTVHGGPHKAVYAYPGEHYGFWRDEYPEIPMLWGYFGENLTTTGLREDEVAIGDTFRIGTATFQVTQPRLPCYKLALRFGRDDIIKRFLVSRRTGFYFSVLEEGSVRATSPIEVLDRDPVQVTVCDIITQFLGMPDKPEVLERVLRLKALPQDWKLELTARSKARAKEQALIERGEFEEESN